MAIVMSLFSESEMKGAASGAAPTVPNVSAPRAEALAPSVSVLSEPAPPQFVEVVARLGASRAQIFDPCVQCRYCSLCDGDDCAMKGFRLDMDHEPSARGWRRYGL